MLVRLIFSTNKDFFISLPTGQVSYFGEEKAHQTVPFCFAVKREPALHLDINDGHPIFSSADYFLGLH